MKIEQYVINKQIIFFEDNFKKRWGLLKYFDINKPLFFFGFGGLESEFENHKGYKIILPGSVHDFPDFTKLKNTKNTILIVENKINPNYYIPSDVICLNMIIPIKDYSMFVPNKMGDKVYFYSGFKNGWQPNPVEFIKTIQSKIEYEIFTTNHLNKTEMYDLTKLKSEYYDKCFVNLNFSNGHGMTSCRELALMGRKTITNNDYYNYNCIIACKNIDEIVLSINEESKKINTTQNSMDVHTYNHNILDVKVILNNKL